MAGALVFCTFSFRPGRTLIKLSVRGGGINLHMNMKHKFFTLIYLIWLIGNTNGAIILTQRGNDLGIEIQNPITFELIRDVNSSRFGFTIPGAIDVAGTGGFQLASNPFSAPSILGNGLSATEPDVGLIRGGPDLEILYFLSDSVKLSEDDFVTLTSGEVTLPNFFSFGIIQGINFNVAETVYLSETSGSLISEPTSTIPEPTAFLLSGIGFVMLTFKCRTRRR